MSIEEQNRTIDGCANVNILPNDEKLICLNNLDGGDKIIFKPQYFELGISGAEVLTYARLSIAEKLVIVANTLPQDRTIIVWDAWRPSLIQQALFDAYYKVIAQNISNDIPQQEIEDLVKRYVSIPSVNYKRPSPHFTGGSIDLTLGDTHGNPLWMGTLFDDFSERAATLYFEDNTHISDNTDLVARNNRRLLLNTMRRAGFTNYPEEWWHFDYGNQFWAKMSGIDQAFYGPVDLNTKTTSISNK